MQSVISFTQSTVGSLRHSQPPLFTPHLTRKYQKPASAEIDTNAKNGKVLKRSHFQHVIRTLDKNALKPHDFLDLSALTTPNIYDGHCLRRDSHSGKFHLQTNLPLERFRTRKSRLCYEKWKTRVPFPYRTQGFLYYYAPPMAPQVAGEIRFRITEAPDPALFEQGVDLHSRNVPWSIPILFMMKYTQPYETFRQMLIRSQLVKESVVDDLKWIVASVRNIYTAAVGCSTLLHSFGQPFYLDMAHMLTIRVLGCNVIYHAAHQFSMFVERDSYRKQIRRPYKGAVVCCFERSTLPEHKNTRTAVIRILKIVEPPEIVMPNHKPAAAMPIEGALLHKYGRTLTYDVDKRVTEYTTCLKVLFKNEEQAQQGDPRFTLA